MNLGDFIFAVALVAWGTLGLTYRESVCRLVGALLLALGMTIIASSVLP